MSDNRFISDEDDLIVSKPVYKIGVAGFSTQKYDISKAGDILFEAIRDIVDKKEKTHGKNIEIVSGLTALGIPLQAYKIAKQLGLKTVGIACSKAKEYDLFPVDKQMIVGNNWGDESKTFINYIDELITVGGGKQTQKEIQDMKNLHKPVHVFDLPAIVQSSHDKEIAVSDIDLKLASFANPDAKLQVFARKELRHVRKAIEKAKADKAAKEGSKDKGTNEEKLKIVKEAMAKINEEVQKMKKVSNKKFSNIEKEFEEVFTKHGLGPLLKGKTKAEASEVILSNDAIEKAKELYGHAKHALKHMKHAIKKHGKEHAEAKKAKHAYHEAKKKLGEHENEHGLASLEG